MIFEVMYIWMKPFYHPPTLIGNSYKKLTVAFPLIVILLSPLTIRKKLKLKYEYGLILSIELVITALSLSIFSVSKLPLGRLENANFRSESE